MSIRPRWMQLKSRLSGATNAANQKNRRNPLRLGAPIPGPRTCSADGRLRRLMQHRGRGRFIATAGLASVADIRPDTGSGAELYTVIGHAPRHPRHRACGSHRRRNGASLPRGSGAGLLHCRGGRQARADPHGPRCERPARERAARFRVLFDQAHIRALRGCARQSPRSLLHRARGRCRYLQYTGRCAGWSIERHGITTARQALTAKNGVSWFFVTIDGEGEELRRPRRCAGSNWAESRGSGRSRSKRASVKRSGRPPAFRDEGEGCSRSRLGSQGREHIRRRPWRSPCARSRPAASLRCDCRTGRRYRRGRNPRAAFPA